MQMMPEGLSCSYPYFSASYGAGSNACTGVVESEESGHGAVHKVQWWVNRQGNEPYQGFTFSLVLVLLDEDEALGEGVCVA
jgi:hypothetical protein